MKIKTFATVLALTICKLAVSQNDECATAISVVSSTNGACSPIIGNSAAATESSEIACVGTNDDDVWYKFVATSTTCSLSVEASVGYDAVLEVFSGACGSLTNIKCLDNAGSGGIESSHLTGLTVGNTYYFRVFDYYTAPSTTTFTICIFNTTPPPNDNCANAINVSVTANCNSPLAGTSFQATESVNVGACTGNNDDDVWYRFTATSTSNFITVNCSVGYDAVIETFSGSCWTATSISCDDHAGDGGLEYSHVSGLTPGQSYFFRVHHYQQNSGTGTFSVCVINSPPPVNDDCLGAININSSLTCSNVVTGTSLFATQSPESACSGSNMDDVWYKFTAAGVTQTLSVECSPAYDAIVEVFDGNCTNLNSIQCIDNASAGGIESFVFGSLTSGNTYYFRVHHYYYTPATSPEFTICLQHGYTPPPSNDDCVNAQNLPVTSPCSQTLTAGTTFNATQSMSGCTGHADDDVWYKFTATSSDIKITVDPSNGMDAVLQLLDGACASLNGIYCADANGTGPGETETIQASGLNIGQTYFIRVYDYSAGIGYPFTISVFTNDVKLNTSKTAMCVSGTATLTITGANTYTWSNGATTSSIIVSPTVTTTYSIAATSTNSCLFSDSVKIDVATPAKPDICLVTTDSVGQYNEIYWEKTLYNNVDSFIVYRETSTGIFSRIGAVSTEAYSMYTDTNRSIGSINGDPNISSNKYKLQIRDTCGNYGPLSLWHQNIYMEDTQTGTFNWNSYSIESTTSPISIYECLRVNLTSGAETLVTSTSGNSYVDPNYNAAWQTNIKWLISGPGFSCNPTQRVAAQKTKTKSNHANDKLVTKINALNFANSISVYPNPAKDLVSVEFKQPHSGETKINVTDVLGKLVYSTSATERVTQIKTDALVSGVYFINIKQQDKTIAVKKLVIE